MTRGGELEDNSIPRRNLIHIEAQHIAGNNHHTYRNYKGSAMNDKRILNRCKAGIAIFCKKIQQ